MFLSGPGCAFSEKIRSEETISADNASVQAIKKADDNNNALTRGSAFCFRARGNVATTNAMAGVGSPLKCTDCEGSVLNRASLSAEATGTSTEKYTR